MIALSLVTSGVTARWPVVLSAAAIAVLGSLALLGRSDATAATRKARTPLVAAAALLGSALVLAGSSVLLPVGFVVTFVVGAACGRRLAANGQWALAGSSVIAIVEWPLIVRQYLDPVLVLVRQQSVASLLTPEEIANARPIGNTVTAGLLGMFLLLGVLLAVGSLRRAGSPVSRRVSGVLLGGHLAAVVATGSRTTMIALAVVAVVAVSSRVVVLLSAVAAVVALRAESGAGRGGVQERLDIIRLAVDDPGVQWWFGAGWGSVPRLLFSSTQGVIYHLHFLPAQVLFELGLVGLLALAAVLCAMFLISPIATAIVMPYVVLDAGVFLEPRAAFMAAVAWGVAAHLWPRPEA